MSIAMTKSGGAAKILLSCYPVELNRCKRTGALPTQWLLVLFRVGRVVLEVYYDLKVWIRTSSVCTVHK